MHNTEANAEQRTQNPQRPGPGCSIALAAVLVALVVAAVLLAPRLADLLMIESAAAPVAPDGTDAVAEFAARHAQEMERLESYGWVDPEAEIAHIPIDRAIAILAEDGLPVESPPTDETDADAEQDADSTAETATPEPTPDLTNVTYQDDVLPIFEEHCAECHGPDEAEEGLELTSYRTALVGSMHGPVIEPGNPDESYLVEQVVSGQMPKRGDPLPQHEIDTIIAWIEAGAPEE